MDLAAAARAHLRLRRSRDQFLPAYLFSEPAWDILLDLFAADVEGRSVSVSSACIAASVPTSTALRWLTKLENQGLVERSDDSQDRRRVYVRITPFARDAIAKWLVSTR
jgi:DNA-binding MarR family transcriptional regulator